MRNLIIAACAFLLGMMLLAFLNRSHAGIIGFPSVAELQAQLNLRPGVELPKAILYQGRVFAPYYVGARARGNGEYVIVIRLRP